MIVAIDPGTTGCLVVLNTNGDIQAFMHMPVIKVGSQNRVNGAAVAAFINDHKPTHCYLERVSSMPGQGVSSTFTFGHSAGLVEGVVVGAGVPLTLVTPQAWKKHAGLIGQDKDAARSRCVQLYPTCREFDLKAKGQALADAVLIGRYGLSQA
jgi:crossover junction endodeoxyribonuclease RuvC